MGIHILRKFISRKVNGIEPVEFELAYFVAVVHHFNEKNNGLSLITFTMKIWENKWYLFLSFVQAALNLSASIDHHTLVGWSVVLIYDLSTHFSSFSAELSHFDKSFKSFK